MPPRGYPGVFLVYAAPLGSAFLDRALYLPKAWAVDVERRQEAGIPETVGFATKGELAKQMLAHAFAAAIPARWVVADEVYGNDGALRRWLHVQERAYVLGVARSHMIWSGETWTQERVEATIDALPDGDWQRLSVGNGSKGPRVYDWVAIRLPFDSPPGWTQGVLARRSLDVPDEIAYYRVFAPEGTTVGNWRAWQERAGRLRSASSGPKGRWDWMSMRCGDGRRGIGTSPSVCSRTLIWRWLG